MVDVVDAQGGWAWILTKERVQRYIELYFAYCRACAYGVVVVAYFFFDARKHFYACFAVVHCYNGNYTIAWFGVGYLFVCFYSAFVSNANFSAEIFVYLIFSKITKQKSWNKTLEGWWNWVIYRKFFEFLLEIFSEGFISLCTDFVPQKTLTEKTKKNIRGVCLGVSMVLFAG